MDNELFILWTNANEITFDKMINMYARNSKIEHWWENVTIIIWGDTQRLSVKSELVKEGLKQLISVGVKLTACKSCADKLGVTEELKEMGIEVKYWGKGLTEIIKEKKNLITI